MLFDKNTIFFLSCCAFSFDKQTIHTAIQSVVFQYLRLTLSLADALIVPTELVALTVIMPASSRVQRLIVHEYISPS